jgi:hypothetical protein
MGSQWKSFVRAARRYRDEPRLIDLVRRRAEPSRLFR